MGDTVNILGVQVSTKTMAETVDTLLGYLDEERVHCVFTPNSEIIYMAYKDPQFAQLLNSADLNTADGIGVVYASRILKQPLRERVAGFDLMNRLLERAAPDRRRVFLFGAKPGVAEEAADKLTQLYPGLVICGTRDGYFKEEQTPEIVEQINAAEPDILLVCLGAPKQEKWIADNRDRLNARIVLGAGGSLDVLAGRVERAPESWQRLGLEWAYRLKKEPKRIGRMTALPRFGLTVLLKGKKYR